jgi:hypothetical protein
MTYTDFFGLVALAGGFLVVLGTWLQWQHSTPAVRRVNRLVFYGFLCAFVAGILNFVLNVFFSESPPFYDPSKSKLDAIPASLLFLTGLAYAMLEIRIAFRARKTNNQRSPADSNT